jgi:hypothetical protein
MSSTTFTNGVTLTDEDWFNDVNRLHYTIFGDPADLGAAFGRIASLTESTSPNPTADYGVVWDASASAGRKVLLSRFGFPTLDTEKSASGATVDFTGIPSWAKRIEVMFAGVSTNGTSNILIQLGDSGGAENTGYASGTGNTGASFTQSTAGLIQTSSVAAARALYGVVTLTLQDSANFTWASKGVLLDDAATMNTSAGLKSLSAALNQIRITMVNGTDVFDGGAFNILYD